jgi:hypothetical protein
MDEEGRAYEDGYEQGFIDGPKKATEGKVSAFIDQSMRRPLTDEEMKKCNYENGFMVDRERAMRNVERAHGIGEKK